MPYGGGIGKIYNASWITPPFLPMAWMFDLLWIGLVPLTVGLSGCSPLRALLKRPAANGDTPRRRWFAPNLQRAQRRRRIVAGALMILVTVSVPRLLAIELWPVGGFAAERVLYDTRLDYRQSDTTVYRFSAPEGSVWVRARLVYLRHWYFMEPIKGEEFWSTDRWKYLLHEVEVDLGPEQALAAADAGNPDGSLEGMPPVPAEPGTGRWVAGS